MIGQNNHSSTNNHSEEEIENEKESSDSNMTNSDDSQFLVRVRAQVMTRDDSSGGWIPLGGGGLSNVSVRKRNPTDKSDYREYLIYGKRISDQSVVLSCIIKKDFQYNRIMPTFHHWYSDNKKFGLTFQTAADARAFDKGVRMAIEDLLDGLTELSPLHTSYAVSDIGDDDVFMTLDLPVERDSISSGSSSGTGPPSQNPAHAHLHRMYFSRSGGGRQDSFGVGGGTLPFKEIQEKEFLKDDEPYSSYVQFARDRPHEYSYPELQPVSKFQGSPHGTLPNSSSFSSANSAHLPKKPMAITLDPLSLLPPPLLPTKSKGSIKKKRTCGKKRRCRDCHEVFSEDCNPRGSCSTGPDIIREGIDKITCMGCARGLLYHCLSSPEGEVPPHPCSPRNHRCTKRWIALTLLSIVLPCLCLYPLCAGCHKAAKSCAICGAKHHAS